MATAVDSPELLVLGIETSCDETAVALVRHERLSGTCQILCNLVGSQTGTHGRHGGVVPELAAREHLHNLPILFKRLQAQTRLEWQALGGIAVTGGPGLAPCLVLGHTFAKTLGVAWGKPVWSMNHLEGHLLSPWLGTCRDVEYPFIGLIVSGGHTLLIRADAPGQYARLGGTVDDAAGEAFDKIARLAGLPYPGGPHLERCARDGNGNPAGHAFPQSFPQAGNLNFSFSGLKTAVRYHLERHPNILASHQARADLCASVQEAICQVLVRKSAAACRSQRIQRLAVSGGVACNGRLHALLAQACAENKIELLVAPPALCTDNAAMIAFAAAHKRAAQMPVEALEEIHPGWPLVAATLANKVPIRNR